MKYLHFSALNNVLWRLKEIFLKPPQIGPDKPYYWTSEGRAEIEFLVDVAGQVIPVEVKAEGNTNGRSLSVYTQKFNPVRRIRISMNNLQENGGLYSIPNPLSDWALKLSGR